MTTVHEHAHVAPAEVHSSLARHMLADGFDIVLDLAKSRGAILHDARSGRDILDFFTHFSSYPIGYNHPKLWTPEFRERILASAMMKPANSDLYTTDMAEFVETFARTVPSAFSQRLFFIEGGALAVENALKTAMDWKVRKNLAAGKGEKGHQIIHFQHAFHGRSGYTLSLTNTADPRKTQYFAKFDWPRISIPKLRFPLNDQILAEVAAAEEQAIAEIKQALVDHPDDIAGLIIEPIQGEGGDNHFRPEFFRELRRLADEAEFLLIYDEVQTGFGMTGSWWCFEQLGVAPDVFAFGKKTQVCGIAASARVDEVESVFKVSSRINSTWGGNLVDMVRCQRIVEIMEEDDLLTNVRTVGAQLVDGLRGLAAEFPALVSNVRGRGLFIAFDLPSADQRNAALAATREVGLMALPCGATSIRFRPPVILSSSDAAEGLRRLRAGIAKIA
jgi:L-lysine 6-transaminase